MGIWLDRSGAALSRRRRRWVTIRWWVHLPATVDLSVDRGDGDARHEMAKHGRYLHNTFRIDTSDELCFAVDLILWCQNHSSLHAAKQWRERGAVLAWRAMEAQRGSPRILKGNGSTKGQSSHLEGNGSTKGQSSHGGQWKHKRGSPRNTHSSIID